MNIGMYRSINQVGLLQEVAWIGDTSVDPSCHIFYLCSVASFSVFFFWYLLPGLCWLLPALNDVPASFSFPGPIFIPIPPHICVT